MRVRMLFAPLLVLMTVFSVQAGVAVIEAEVDGSDFLLIRGNTVQVVHRNFEPLQNLHYRFDPQNGLPSEPISVTLNKLDGTGEVQIIEQPSYGNNYTMKILVNNDNEGVYPQLYRLRLEWTDRSSTMFSNMDRRLYDYVHWRGRVDGTDLIRFRGRDVNIKHVRARPIQDQRFDFSAPLPRSGLTTYLQVQQARGGVEIVQQPDLQNDFTTIVRVDDGRFGGDDIYDFYLYWKKEDAVPNRGGDDDFVWEGKVDGVDKIVVQGTRVEVIHTRARPIEDAVYTFRKELPEREQTVSLHVMNGRGKVSILEQPTRWNGYAVKVLLDDSDSGGASDYKFGLQWEGGRRVSRQGRGTAGRTAGGGVIRWSGRVDGRDRLVIQGNRIRVEHLDAQPIRNMSQTFSDPLPRRAVSVTLNKLEGRGDVRIVQQPGQSNGYTLIVEIDDSHGGADNYEFELIW